MKFSTHVRTAFVFCSLLISSNAWSQLTVTLTSLNPICDHDGIIVASIQNGFTTNTYQWYANGLNVTHTHSDFTDTIFNYGGGYISVQVIPGNGAQWAYQWLNVAYPFNVTSTVVPDSCPLQNGSITLSVNGGVAPYTYDWTFNGNPYPGNTNALTNLAGGAYDCHITDASGCNVFLHEMDSSIGLVVYSINNISISMAQTPANCLNGTATATPSGGTAPFTYLWSNGQTTATATGLTAWNSYMVTVTDANGCFKQAYVYIQSNSTLNVTSSITHAHCTFSDGAASAIVTGGTAPYSYIWSTMAVTSSIQNIPAGTYYATVTDGQGCLIKQYFNVLSLTPVNATYTTTASECTTATGSATLNATGGTAPYTYLWYSLPQQSTATATNLGTGNYNFLVTDAQGCIRTGTATIPPNSTLSQNIGSVPNTTCLVPNGTATVVASGGVNPLQYSWSNGQTTQTATGLSGFIFGTVTDAAGCAVAKCVTIQDISPVSVTIATQNATCLYVNDGSAQVTPFGGTPPYTYSWSNGATTQTASNLLPGTYYVHVTDANGCKDFTGAYVGYNSTSPCTGSITGVVFIDLNGNCAYDMGEITMEHIPMHCSSSGETHYTNAFGQYQFTVPLGSSDITQLSRPYRFQACPAANPFTVSIAVAGTTVIQDVADTIVPVNDLKAGFYNLNAAVVGHQMIVRLVDYNEGTTALPTLTRFNYDPQVPFVSSVPAPSLLDVSQHFVEFTNPLLTPFQTATTDLTFNVPVSVPLSTMLYYTDSLFPIMGDTTWWNNTLFDTRITQGPFDPNYKEVRPKGNGPQGLISPNDSILEYVIHFQNVGNYQAENIVLTDTLDANLNWQTLQPGYSTHPHTTEISATGVLKMTFSNINLPAVTDDSIGSNGFATYTIHLDPNLADGTVIENSADIYFDFNAAVKTNTTVNTISITGVEEEKQDHSLHLYPNPSDGHIMLLTNGFENQQTTIKIFNLTGQQVFEKKVAGSQRMQIDVSHLDDGLYMIQLVSGDTIRNRKLSINH